MTYRLVERADAEDSSERSGKAGEVSLADRERGLGQLYRALLHFASEHDNRFPDDLAQFDEQDRTQPGGTAIPYGYIPGITIQDTPSVIAFEHQLYDDDTQLALLSNGEIQALDELLRNQIARRIKHGPESSP